MERDAARLERRIQALTDKINGNGAILQQNKREAA